MKQLVHFHNFYSCSPLFLCPFLHINQPRVGAVMVDPVTSQVVATGQTVSSHPLQHAVMVCIDRVATVQGGGAWQGKGTGRESLLQTPADTSGDNSGSGNRVTSGSVDEAMSSRSYVGFEASSTCELSSETAALPPAKRSKEDAQYLCTNYDLYTTVEPCIM